MRRREFIALLTGASLARAARAEAPPGAVVGFVGGALAPEHLQTAFHRGLNEAGYVEGRNVKFENRWVGTTTLPRRP
jgi:putative tryptophan/tyrosine transport system substrate-binding protein